VLTSQGIAFMHAGVDFLRSKPSDSSSHSDEIIGGYDRNTYNRSDAVNQLRWDRKAQYVNVFNYYKEMITIRKTYQHFRLDTAEEIISQLQFFNVGDRNLAYKIEKDDVTVVVVHVGNNNTGSTSVNLGDSLEYTILSRTIDASHQGYDKVTGSVNVPDNTTMVLVSQVLEPPIYPVFILAGDEPVGLSWIIWTGIGLGFVGMGIGAFFLFKKKKIVS
ncbi:MAG: hypothetical protein IH571_03665, partial [Acholeplasmataceae bacterium]|nr:hypothetical protein [Acholeplasmataceae bacterium]